MNWKDFRSKQTAKVENELRRHFQAADCFVWGGAVRVRVIGHPGQFRGLSEQQRADMISLILNQRNMPTMPDAAIDDWVACGHVQIAAGEPLVVVCYSLSPEEDTPHAMKNREFFEPWNEHNIKIVLGKA